MLSTPGSTIISCFTTFMILTSGQRTLTLHHWPDENYGELFFCVVFFFLIKSKISSYVRSL